MEKISCFGSPEVLLPEMREYLSRGEGFWLVVTGTSMYPTLLHESDRVFVEPLTGELRVGDILLVLAGDCHCVLHRVTRISEPVFYMQGDALYSVEGPVPKTCILGVATHRRRKDRIQRLARHKSVRAVLYRSWIKVRGRGKRMISRCIPKKWHKLLKKQ
jgi:signal peptidase I